ncbi:MAG: right-handed parallel beta-helix repeat-containing protein, partial [Candidatus Hodarchaeales archaeon]
KINQFDSPPAIFTGDFWDYGVYTDFNGRFDLLFIAMEINVTLESTFVLYTEISRSGISFSSEVSFSMYPGIQIVNVSFETPPIHKQFFASNEPLFFHVSHVMIEYITPPDTRWLSDRLSHPYTTEGYALETFDLIPFPIDSNAFLSYVAAFEEWPGGGTKNDPYIINGSYFDSLDRYLEVKNTVNHFFMCNWILSEGRTGISLENVQNAIITHNDISNCNTGIHLKDCYSIAIERNRIHSNNMGIQVGTIPYLSVEPSYNISIIDNLFYHNHKYGVYINPMSQFNRIQGNDFLDNNPNGISQAFDQGENNIFIYNYWSPLNEEVQQEEYLIDGPAYNKDLGLVATPNHLTTPLIIIPNGGESFTKQVVIHWLKVNDTFDQEITYSIYYSTDAGDSWDLLDSGLSDVYEVHEGQNGKTTCRYVGEVGTLFSTGDTFLIRIIAEDPFGFITMDTSDTSFNIESVKSSNSWNGKSPPAQNNSFFPILQILGLGSILFFVITLVIIIKQQKKK